MRAPIEVTQLFLDWFRKWLAAKMPKIETLEICITQTGAG
jgi:hypothetical protein